MEKLAKGQLQNGSPYYQEKGILKRFVEDGKQKFEAVVLPQVLIGAVLQLAHEGLGHNGSPRTYAALMRFISMDLIVEFHPPSSKGNRYALTVICMFTGYTFCI